MADAVLLLLDYGQLEHPNLALVLQQLGGLRPRLTGQANVRLFVAVNKIDIAGATDGMDELETRQYVCNLINTYLRLEEVQAFQPEQARQGSFAINFACSVRYI